jgi:hypothetical protein
MSSHDCQLTIAIPAMLEEDVLDFLGEHSEWVSGFTVVHAEGFGTGAQLLSTLEQVRGRAKRVLIMTLIDSTQHEILIATLSKRYPSNEIAWWTTPVSGFGRLA